VGCGLGGLVLGRRLGHFGLAGEGDASPLFFYLKLFPFYLFSCLFLNHFSNRFLGQKNKKKLYFILR
jgi:hypothetical protein